MRPFRHILGGAVSLICLGSAVNQSAAVIAVQPWQPLYQGVDLMVGTADASDGRVQRVTAVRIDLSVSGIGFTSTASNGGLPLDTVSQSTTEFLAASNTQVAVNTSFYTPCCSGAPQNKDIIGLAVTDGMLVSPAQSEARAVLLIDAFNGAGFVNTVADPFSLTGVDTAFAGSNFVLGVGRELPATADTIHPARTLVGLGDRELPGDNQLLYLVTIDAGLPGVSDGATRRESAEWLMRLGAHTGVNLDGGGSTLMAAINPVDDSVVRLNAKLGGERSNANHLGVFADPVSGLARHQFTPLWFAGLPDNSVSDFSAEDAVMNPSPGSATARDDDYYFAGTYPGPIGTITSDEPLGNLERAVIRFDPPNDTELRFHFNLTPEQVDGLSEFRYLTSVFQQDGQGGKAVELELLFNGVSITTDLLSEGDIYTSVGFLARGVGAQPGANVFTVRQIGGDANWTNFDYHRLDFRLVPEPATFWMISALGLLIASHRNQGGGS